MKIVAIGGGNYALDDTEKPYNVEIINEEIVKLSNKKHPRFLNIGFNIRSDYYFSFIKKIFSRMGCQCEYLRFNEFDNFKTVDSKWIEHIDMMDRLKRGISLRSFANEDPLNAYKKEGLDMFEEMTASIQEDTVKYLLKIEVEKVPQRTERKNYVESGGALDHEQKTVVNRTGSIGRNDPCPCGSGKKYKNCCGR